MVSSVSTAGKLLFNIRNLRSQQVTHTEKINQYQTGQKYDEISKYSQQVPLILKYRQQIDDATRFQSAAQAVINTLDIAETAFEKLDDATDRITALIREGLGFNSDIDPERYESWRVANEDVVNDLLQEVTDLLNTRVGDRFIFSGSHYNDAPVRRLDQLDDDNFFVLENAAIAGDPDFRRPLSFDEYSPDAALGEVTDYSRLSATNIISAASTAPIASGATATLTFDVDEASYRRSAFKIDEAQTQIYGVSSNDETFARLTYIIRNYKQALQQPVQADREAFLRAALNESQTTINGIKRIRQEENYTNQDIILAQEENNKIKQLRENYLADIVTIDRETVSVEVSALKGQIEASLTLISGQRSLSLVNYL